MLQAKSLTESLGEDRRRALTEIETLRECAYEDDIYLFSGGNFRMKSSCVKAQSPRVVLVKCSDSLNAA